MKIINANFHQDFIGAIQDGSKVSCRHPLIIQPEGLYDGVFSFGEQPNVTKIYQEDLLCPHGMPGDLIRFYCEGNSVCFHEAKIRSVDVERLKAITDPSAIDEGCIDTSHFYEIWESIYGSSEYAMRFDPFVYIVRFK